MHAVLVNCLFVGAGGFIGAILRYVFAFVPIPTFGAFPVHTFIVNLLGSIFIGAIFAATQSVLEVDHRLIAFLQVGFCGGFTTFSTFSLECSELISSGNYAMFALYAAASVALCVAGVFIGHAIAVRV